MKSEPSGLRTKDFDYDLPQELIAQVPVEPRDSSRLLVYDRKTDEVRHRIFREIGAELTDRDVLVVNNTRVQPVRLLGRKKTGAQIEFLLMKRLDLDTFEAVVRPGKKLRIGAEVIFSEELSAQVLAETDFGGRVVKFRFEGVFEDILDRIGQMPLPPYIHETLADKQRYNTVYAAHNGSAAAPTAGLHFTPTLLESLREKGVRFEEVLLHVGLGTFRPVKAEKLEDHKMHSEHYEISEETAERLNAYKREGRRIVAVGTTSVRTLESAADETGILHAGKGDTSIFIYPPYRFRFVDALVTNFHLPESTLIMLVSALAGREKTLELYRTAVEKRYRFFSFGDAMMVL